MSAFDQTARRAAKMRPLRFLTWILPRFVAQHRFLDWHDTRTVPFPGEPDGVDGEALRRRLWDDHRIEVLLPILAGKLLLRVSTHSYNTQNEVDQLVEALDNVLS